MKTEPSERPRGGQKGKAGMQAWEEGSRIQAFAGQGEARVALAYGF